MGEVVIAIGIAIASAIAVGILNPVWRNGIRTPVDSWRIRRWLGANVAPPGTVDLPTVAKGTRIPEDRVRVACLADSGVHRQLGAGGIEKWGLGPAPSVEPDAASPSLKSAWAPDDVTAYLSRFFEMEFMRARDEYDKGDEARLVERLKRGLGPPQRDHFATESRIQAARVAYPALVAEVKRLASEGKIPLNSDGGAFSKGVFAKLRGDSPPRAGDEQAHGELVRASLRAEAELTLFFQRAALPGATPE